LKIFNSIEFRLYEFAYRVPEKDFLGFSKQADFLIDGELLGQVFNVWPLRPWFGRTGFENSKVGIELFIQELLGAKTAQNQFGTNRLVLFGCHCGCDYCGIISCEIIRNGDIIEWRDIRLEEQGDFGPIKDLRIESFKFDFSQYAAAVMNFVDTVDFA
jgi:hypothetical protein